MGTNDSIILLITKDANHHAFAYPNRDEMNKTAKEDVEAKALEWGVQMDKLSLQAILTDVPDLFTKENIENMH